MIDKDLKPLYRAMVKTTYVPVMRKAIVLLLIADMDRMQAGLRVGDLEFFEVLRTDSAKKALCICLDAIAKKRNDIIQEILLQYGINTSNSMTDFYYEHMNEFFLKIIKFIKHLVGRGRYDMLDRIARGNVNE